MIVGLSSTMLASKSLLSAKEEVNNDANTIERIVFPVNPSITSISNNADEKQAHLDEKALAIASNISLVNVVPMDFMNEPITQSVIGVPFFLDLTFFLTGNFNQLRGNTFVYNFPNKYLDALPSEESTIMLNQEKVGTVSKSFSGDTSFEFRFDEDANLDVGEGGTELHFKPLVRLKEEMAYTDRDKITEARLVIENSEDRFSDELLPEDGYPVTILPHQEGAFDWLANAEEYGLNPPTLYGVSPAEHWEDYAYFLGYSARFNMDSILSKSPNYVGTRPGDTGIPYYFFGMTDKPSNGGLYYPDQIAVCIDVLHSLVKGNGQKSDLEDYIGFDAAEDLQYGLHMAAMLAEEYGQGVGPGTQVIPGPTTPNIPIVFGGNSAQMDQQKYYLYAGQLRAWVIAAKNNLNPGYVLNMDYSDITSSGGSKNTNMTAGINAIEEMIEEFKNFDYVNRTPKKMKVGETLETFKIPTSQQKFIHYVDFEESKGLDKVTLIGVETTTGVIEDKLSVKANTSIEEGEVEIVIRKNTSDFWNSDLGFDALYDGTGQKKAVFTMRQEYQRMTSVSVFTDSDYNLEIEKTDGKGNPLAGALFNLESDNGDDIIPAINSNGKFTFEGLEPEVTYTLTETKAPEGYQKKEESYTIVMDANGKLSVKEGTKTLVAGQDYKWDENNLVLSFSVKNEKLKKEIVLTKFDKDTMDPLEGAVFIIQPYNMFAANPYTWASNYNVTGEINKEFVTDSRGQIVINEETYPGVIDQLIKDYNTAIKIDGKDIYIKGYRFREIQAPEGYPDPGFNKDVLLEEKDAGKDFSAEINMDDLMNNTKTDFAYSVTNTKKVILGNAELVKFDVQNTNITLAGAKFDLYKEGESTPYRSDLETNEQGKLLVPNLPLGDYYFVETKAPNGYTLPEGEANRFEFSITEENASANVTVNVPAPNVKENVPTGSVKLYKHDSKDDKQGLEHAEFSLYRKGEAKPLYTNEKTNSEGILIISDLPFGEYYFVETKAPSGYFLDDSQYPFEITEANIEIPVEVRISNIKAPPRELTLTKTDEGTGEPIPGVVFIIQNRNTFFNEWGPVDTGVNKQPLVTDENGQIIINDTTYPGLIDHMIELNEKPDVSGMRFREISTPEGWVDPYPTKSGQKDSANDLSANDFAKDIPMDTLKGSPLSDEPIHVVLAMKNKKEQNDQTIIQVEKRDKTTGNLITDGEATFIIQSLRKDNQWSAFSDQQFTTQNGVAVIEDEELIDDLLKFQGGENDQKYRFREIEAPEGYKDPQAPSPLSANEAPGGIGDEFSKEFTLGEENSSTVMVVVENEKPEDPVDPVDRAVTLKKEDDTTDKALPGAVFEIERYDAGSDTWKPTGISNKTTNSNGSIALTEQEISSLGSDYPIYIAFKEVTPPSGYEMPANPYTETITITADGATPDYVLKENHAIPKDREMTLKKVDGFSNMALEGAEFQLYKEDENGEYQLYDFFAYRTFETDSNGEYPFDEKYEIQYMENGNYKLKEVVAPEGYEIPDDPFTEMFTVSDTGVTPNRIVKKNYKISGFMLKKVDQTGKPVKGAKFHLYKYPGPGATGTPERYIRDDYRPDDWTDENGEIIIDRDDLKEMEDGVYFWREIEAPDGYEILEQDTKTFTVQNGIPNPPIIQHVNQYNGRSFEFHKVDDRNGAPYDNGLNGAVFELEKEVRPNTWEVVNDKQTDPIRFTTKSYFDDYWELDVPGSIYLNDQDIENYGLANGTYRLREIKAPPGYELPDDPYTKPFVLSASGFSPEYVEKTNSRLSDRELILKKVDGRDQSKGLAGAEFELEYTDRDDDGWYTYSDNQGKPVIFTTNENGEILLDDETIYDIYHIGEGLNQKGRFKEVKAPEGYLLPDDVYSEEFIIQPTEITDINGRPITEIKKVNYKFINNYELELLKVNDNEVRLDGAEFTLVPSDGSGQPQVSTGDKGIFNFKDLEPDVEYTLTETKAPDDYFINKTPYTFILRTDEDPDGILEVYYNGKQLEEGKDYEWNNTQLQLSLVMINRKSSMPITGSVGIIGLLIAGATAIGVAYNFQLKKKKVM
ncbi:putative LPXTG-motif-containing peptidoglycan bound protein [Enterococcus sp. 5H]|nr:putative LPXTG-motif-containing peptidoglycan bound protein [Enterococcus sp. 5H]